MNQVAKDSTEFDLESDLELDESTEMEDEINGLHKYSSTQNIDTLSDMAVKPNETIINKNRMPPRVAFPLNPVLWPRNKSNTNSLDDKEINQYDGSFESTPRSGSSDTPAVRFEESYYDTSHDGKFEDSFQNENTIELNKIEEITTDNMQPSDNDSLGSTDLDDYVRKTLTDNYQYTDEISLGSADLNSRMR